MGCGSDSWPRRVTLSIAIAIAIGLVVIASFCFAGGAILQHMAISADQTAGAKQEMSLRQILGLLRKPRWVLGLALVGFGAALHLIALTQAPVTVIQPVGILAVPWSVLVASKIYGYRTTPAVWLAVGATVVGIVGFTMLSTRYSDDHRATIDFGHMIIAIAVCYGIGFALVGLSRVIPEVFRSFALAAGGAVLYGLASALMKSMFVFLGRGEHFLSPGVVVSFVGIIATYVIGGWMIQQGYALGHPEIVVGALTTIDPLVAVIYGLFVLNEGVGITPLVVVGMTVAGALATAGVAGLSRYHPEARQRAEASGPA